MSAPSDDQYRDFVEGSDDLLTRVDATGRLLYVNRAARRIYGMPPEDCIGRSAFEFVHPDDRARTEAAFAGWIANRVPSATFENRQLSRTGEVRDLLWTINPQFDGQGELRSVTSIGRDITERKEAEEQFRALLESAPDGIVIVDERGLILLVNGETERMFGYDREELVGKPVEVVVPDRLRDTHVGHRSGYFAHPGTRPMGLGLDLVARRRDGSELSVEISLSPVERAGRLLVIAVVRDISERQRIEAQRASAESELEAQRARSELRREVMRGAIAAQEEERRRIARELHDATGQSLTGALLTLRRISQATDLEAARADALQLRDQLAEALREVRGLATRLRPTALDDLGLRVAIERLVEEAPFDRSGCAVEFVPGNLDRLDSTVETVIYRIVQEAITNAARHAMPERVSIRLSQGEESVTAVIRDDGRGFQPDRAASGLGLAGMRERAELVGGRLAVESAPGGGTTIRLQIPWRRASA